MRTKTQSREWTLKRPLMWPHQALGPSNKRAHLLLLKDWRSRRRSSKIGLSCPTISEADHQREEKEKSRSSR
jgi:hypothetical protein